MTHEDVVQALSDETIGFDPLSERAVRSPSTAYCNNLICAVYAAAATAAGVSAYDLALSVGEAIDGDPSALNEIFNP